MIAIRILREFAFLIGALALAGLVHLAAILLVPSFVPVDAYTRLGTMEGGFQLQPATTAQNASRLADPAMAVAICRYDLDEAGAIRISGRANMPYWGLWLHNAAGQIHYTINNRGAGERALDLRIMMPDDITRLRADLPEAAEQSLLIPAPEPRGFAVLRALVPTPNARPRIEAELGNMRCEPIEIE